MLLDEYLDKNNSSRYQLSMLTGIPQSTLQRYNEKKLRDCPIKLLDALGMLLGKKSWEVLQEMRGIEKVDELNGFKTILEKYDCSFPELENQLKKLLNDLDKNGQKVEPFSFNHFENEDHEDVKADLEKALRHTIKMLENISKKL